MHRVIISCVDLVRRTLATKSLYGCISSAARHTQKKPKKSVTLFPRTRYARQSERRGTMMWLENDYFIWFLYSRSQLVGDQRQIHQLFPTMTSIDTSVSTRRRSLFLVSGRPCNRSPFFFPRRKRSDFTGASSSALDAPWRSFSQSFESHPTSRPRVAAAAWRVAADVVVLPCYAEGVTARTPLERRASLRRLRIEAVTGCDPESQRSHASPVVAVANCYASGRIGNHLGDFGVSLVVPGLWAPP